jgi:hypothetical protein
MWLFEIDCSNADFKSFCAGFQMANLGVGRSTLGVLCCDANGVVGSGMKDGYEVVKERV